MLASLVIIPLVTHGITLISRLQLWTQPLWAVLWVAPFIYVACVRPQAYVEFTSLSGRTSGHSDFSLMSFGMAATVAFSLIVQVGEQVDFLRFLPEKTQANRRQWWTALLVGRTRVGGAGHAQDAGGCISGLSGFAARSAL